MKKFIGMLFTGILAVALGIVGLSSPSFADGPPAGSTPTCVTNNAGTTVCTASSAGKSTVNIVDHDATKAATHGVTNVYYVQSGGATHKQMQGKHFRLKHGMTLKTSWRVDRGYGWHAKYYPKGYTFVRGSDGYWHDPVCWNSVVGIPHGKTHVGHMIRTKISVHRYFSVTSVATATAEGTGWAAASCTTNNASAYGQAVFNVFGHAVAKATAKGSSWAQATANARKALAKQLTSVKSKAAATATASATAKAYGTATANAYCSSSSQPTTSTPPTCQSVYGPGYSGNYPNCTKDGTATPPPPSSAPGPNPSDPPAGQPGGSGSNECYSETTGQPVTPNADGTCPPGSYGA